MANISFLVEYFPGGGVERVIMNLAQPLAEKGHKIFLFVHFLNRANLPSGLPIEYIELPHPARSSKNYKFMVDAIKANHIDIFFAPGRFPKFLPKLREEGLCKLVYALHGCPFYEKLEKWGAISHPKQRTVKEWLRRWLVDYPKFKLGYYDRKMNKRYETIYHAVDRYGVLFKEYGEMVAKKLGVPYEESKCFVLQNPMDAPQSAATATREKRVTFVGRLSYWDKRIDRLLAAWKLIYNDFPEWRLSIVGSGPELKTLTNIVEKEKLQRVEFLGFIPDPTSIYASSEILCLTSSIEGCPMVLLEAQAYGCATMAFDCSAGVHELLAPNWENGVYVPNGDIKAYAKALARLMSDDALRAEIQRNGLENVKRFSVEVSVEHYHALIEELMHN